jgi:hypothetical protein
MAPATEIVALAHGIADRHGLDETSVCAVVEQEPAWDPYAMRYEPGFRTHYVAPLGLPSTEEIARYAAQVIARVARYK